MRCPKCQYISFDNGERCRNCGYEFSFSTDTGALDLPLKTGDEPVGPLSDFSLDDVDGFGAAAAANAPAAESGGGARVPRSVGPNELPLFRDRRIDEDAPLVSLPATPRAPVAVRKSSPALRPAASRRPLEEPELDLDFPDDRRRDVAVPAHVQTTPSADAADAAAVGTASAGSRLLAAIIDGALLLCIDAAVLYFTLKICGLRFAEIAILPVTPFLAFLALSNGGYMAGLTAAGGQSIGKMAAGIKVVTADPDAWTDRVPLGQAVLRVVGYLVSALPAGLGFLPAFIGAERRAVHDRLAHTRVVKA